MNNAIQEGKQAMQGKPRTTVVTACDGAYAWGTILLAASMRRNGMRQPVVVGAVEWPETMKRRLLRLDGVTIVDFPRNRRCVTCQKPMIMLREEVQTDWVCWADSDGMFIGDCSEWLESGDPDEIIVRQYEPVPPDFTPENLETWRRDVERHCGSPKAGTPPAPTPPSSSSTASGARSSSAGNGRSRPSCRRTSTSS